MKLTELEPTLDPRRPLHFAATGTPGAATRPPRSTGRHAALGAPTDLRSVDAVMARLASSAPVADRTLQDWQAVTDGLHHRPSTAAIRARAAASVGLFTGAATGLIVALWRQEADQLESQLRAGLVATWAELVRRRGAADAADGDVSDADLTSLREASAAAQDAWHTLTAFDGLHRAFSGGDVRALSPAAAADLTARPLAVTRAAAGFDRRGAWRDGVLWSPSGLIAWSSDGDGTALFTVTGPDLADWVRGLASAAPSVLRWTSTFVGPDLRFGDLTADWRRVVETLVHLVSLGAVGGTSEATLAVPVTRYVVTRAEARTGVAPVDLSSGLSPADREWEPAHFRETFSVAQNRRIRVFVDACRRGDRPPVVPILVTVLPH